MFQQNCTCPAVVQLWGGAGAQLQKKLVSTSRQTAVVSEPAVQPSSRVTGEGSSTKVTGDDWDRGEHVTGTEGASARRRNPSRPGPMGAMAPFERKRNVHEDWPVSPVTGSNGNTDKGSLITVSGGARG